METVIIAALLWHPAHNAPCGMVDNTGHINRPVIYALQDKNTGALEYCVERVGCSNHVVGRCIITRDPANDYDTKRSYIVRSR